jgi:hypothetical protein
MKSLSFKFKISSISIYKTIHSNLINSSFFLIEIALINFYSSIFLSIIRI